MNTRTHSVCYGQSEKTAIYVIVDTLFGPKCIYISCVQSNSVKCRTSVFRKENRSTRSNSTWYVLNSLNNPAARLPLSKKLCTTFSGFKGRALALLLIVLTFLTHHMPMERSKNAAMLCSQPKYKLSPHQEAPKIQIPPYYGHTAVILTVSILEELIYCIPTNQQNILITCPL